MTGIDNLKRGLVAILRGVKPQEAVVVSQAAFEAGIEAIEIPLNSPDPFRSIEAIARDLPANALVGAGTVLCVENVDRLHNVGGRLLVSPNIDENVMRQATKYQMVTMPGVFTATEAFQAVRLAASALKFFPASVLGANGLAAIKAVLPHDVRLAAVGGVSEADFKDYTRVGISLFGLGSTLYRPGMTVADVGARAAAIVHAYDKAIAPS